MPQRILVVDDDKEVVRLMRAYLEQAGYEVLVAYDGETALFTMRQERPDLLLLDLMLPGKDGWEITRLIRADRQLAATPIIMLTARIEDTDKIVGLEMGADDYVTKPYNPREVVARVRARLRRPVAPDEPRAEVLRVGELVLDLGRREASVGDRPVELTATEFNILQLLMESPGFVFTREELIDKALGQDYEGLDRTLDSHIRNLRRKLEPDGHQARYIKTVYGIGYRLAEER
ncbi:MAG: response regulator transcription factor [Anaerolineales bacterium]|nr:response regulator transcription factor [Anaerolineales bacterium]MCB0032221.1 response regulator transcription factor [Anaerolineales bacterium]MCB8958836.1 response regulator transcription factor [Ardenticatenales bacterium]